MLDSSEENLALNVGVTFAHVGIALLLLLLSSLQHDGDHLVLPVPRPNLFSFQKTVRKQGRPRDSVDRNPVNAFIDLFGYYPSRWRYYLNEV